jgi:hypothetical protein
MHLSNYLASILTLTTLASALPTATLDASPEPAAAALLPRACTTIPPSSINILQKGDPSHPHNGLIFNLARGGNPPSNEYISVVTFTNIPPGATGCMLRVQFPPLQYPNQITIGPANQADVWSVAPDPNGLSTWNNPPARDQWVATTRFPEAKSETPTEGVLASNTCSPTMSFLFEQSDWQGGGSVRFYNSAGGNSGLPPLGFSMVFNC